MYGFIFKFFAVAVALLVALYTAANTFRNARKLDARVREYKREQEARQRSGGAIDPYSELAELYSERTKPVKTKKSNGH
jgi:hypothetical protein